jgi:hypothetical protein
MQTDTLRSNKGYTHCDLQTVVADDIVRGMLRPNVKALGRQSFDCQFEPYLRVLMAAPLWCGLGFRSRIDGRILRINRSQFFDIISVCKYSQRERF